MMPKIVRLKDFKLKDTVSVYFTKIELNQLLSHYSLRVISGEWKDYAILINKNIVGFNIYRKATENPLYQIIKNLNAKSRNQKYENPVDRR